MKQGLKLLDTAEKIGMAVFMANPLLPYSKGVYKMSEVSAAAERMAFYRARKESVAVLQVAVLNGEWSIQL